jgi:predicted DNA-binding ribbon-helix-helix protein
MSLTPEQSSQYRPTRGVLKRSIVVAGHKTSISLEDAFWVALRSIAHARGITLSTLVADIDAKREHANLSSAIRLFVLDYYQKQADVPLQAAQQSHTGS